MIYRHDLHPARARDDGHTASLFPGTAALEERARKVVANFVPKLNAWRLTFTFRLINQARRILLPRRRQATQTDRTCARWRRELPAARVAPVAGDLTWIIGQSSLSEQITAIS